MSDDQENLNEFGDEGSSSSEVKADVKPEIPNADEKGVPYYNRFRELEAKYKDVDLDLYNKAKSLDFSEVEEALNFKNEIYSDKDKLAKVLEVLKGQQAQEKSEGKQANPELQAVIQELNAIKSQLQAKDQGEWMKQYDSSVEKSLQDCLKSDDFKDLGGKLSNFEKTAIMKMVDDTFQADAAKGRLSKLSLKDVPNVVQGIMKMVSENRKESLGGSVKKDDSPQPMNGSGSSGQPKDKPMSDEERIQSMQNYMRQVEAGKVPA